MTQKLCNPDSAMGWYTSLVANNDTGFISLHASSDTNFFVLAHTSKLCNYANLIATKKLMRTFLVENFRSNSHEKIDENLSCREFYVEYFLSLQIFGRMVLLPRKLRKTNFWTLSERPSPQEALWLEALVFLWEYFWLYLSTIYNIDQT